MNVIIHRGENQIGGNIVELATDQTRILLDVGLELDQEELSLPAIEGLFDHGSFDAVFISHYHGDHLGLAYYIDCSIPLYIGEASYRIVRAADEYKGVDTIQPAGFLNSGAEVVIGDIKVKPFLCDHSAFDSYMLLCEGDGERVLYTGDFRANGRKSFARLLRSLPTRVDKLICEGTTLTRANQEQVTEADLEEDAVSLFRETSGPIFVLQSSTNIDRIVTMYRAAKRSGRIFLQEVYMADVATAAGATIPNPSFNDVFAFITNPARYDALTKYRNRIGKAQLAQRPFVMCIRSSMLRYMKSLSEIVPFAGGVLVYSMWDGYKEQAATKEFLTACEELGLRVVSLHTSGHADPRTIRKLIKHTAPRSIMPIHTENAKWFENLTKDEVEY